MSGRGRGTPTTSPTRWNRRASSWASSHSGGSGHVSPACWARRQYSDTVPRPTPQARAMARWARRCSYFSRRISRTCLINSLSVMSVGALLPRGLPYRVGQATDERSGSESAITIPGTGDQDASEYAGDRRALSFPRREREGLCHPDARRRRSRHELELGGGGDQGVQGGRDHGTALLRVLH